MSKKTIVLALLVVVFGSGCASTAARVPTSAHPDSRQFNRHNVTEGYL